ncbi:MAG: replication factor C large subunit [Methanobrevibacter sp.]|jgi:replication factor C large subunit|nr:replication factor C large subunit [Methanobrevibacter sp.]
MLWTDKYRPQSFEEVVGSKNTVSQIKNWINKWNNNEAQKPLLLTGPAGIGKTTLALIIAKEIGEFVELNASDKRSYDIIMETVGESSSTQSLYGMSHKLIIIDEIDGISGNDDRGGTRAINKIMANTKQPIIMMANDFYSKRLATIKTKCLVIKMPKIRSPTITVALRKIARNENIEVENDALKELSKRSNGDLRSAINTFQAMVSYSNSLTMEDLDDLEYKDNTSNIFDSVIAVLKSKNVKHVKEALFSINEDPTLVMEYIAENIPREYTNKNEIKKAYEMISEADFFFGKARQTREYTYWRYASEFMGSGVALSKKETYKKFSKIQSPMAFNLMARSRGKRKLRDEIAEKISKKCHVSKQIAISYFPLMEIIFKNDLWAWEFSDFIGLDDSEIKHFRTKKIPKKLVNELEHKKAIALQNKYKNSLSEGNNEDRNNTKIVDGKINSKITDNVSFDDKKKDNLNKSFLLIRRTF